MAAMYSNVGFTSPTGNTGPLTYQSSSNASSSVSSPIPHNFGYGFTVAGNSNGGFNQPSPN